MDKIIKHIINLYIQGLITKEELASLIAKEYTKLWVRGQILKLISNEF
jgi:hypothetical protein